MAKVESSKDVQRKLEAAGFALVRQTGSHLMYRHPDGRKTVVPAGRKALPTGTQRSIYRQAQLKWPPE